MTTFAPPGSAKFLVCGIADFPVGWRTTRLGSRLAKLHLEQGGGQNIILTHILTPIRNIPKAGGNTPRFTPNIAPAKDRTYSHKIESTDDRGGPLPSRRLAQRYTYFQAVAQAEAALLLSFYGVMRVLGIA